MTFDYHLDQEKEEKQLSKARLTLLKTPAEMTFTHSELSPLPRTILSDTVIRITSTPGAV